MARRYAQGTEVLVAKTKADLEELLRAHGAKSTAVFNQQLEAAIAFEMHDRRIVMKITLPAKNEPRFTLYKLGSVTHRRAEGAAVAMYEGALRQKWRALFLAVKAKLVSVQEGIETFEEAFMAHVVMPDGRTIGEHVTPRISEAYKGGKMLPLLPGPAQ